MFVPNIAQSFQDAGITALVYDPRTIASSDGTPRNNINPAQQVTDYHDALTFLKSDPRVDANRIAYWGFSFSGAVALNAAALDKRAKLVVAVCPLTIWELPESKRQRVMAKVMQDRESQLAGNPPFYLPMLTDKGENPAGFGGSGMGPDELRLVAEAKEKVPGFNANTTIQTYYNIMAWNPFDLIRFIAPTPALLVTPQEDAISPADKQRELYYDCMQGPKHLHLVPGRGHMNVLDGDSFTPVMDAQVEFIRSYLGT